VPRPSTVTPDQKQAIADARDSVPRVPIHVLAVQLGLPITTVRHWTAVLRPATLAVKPANRLCMTCREPFASEGNHNRMCDPCRKRDVSPFKPDHDSGVPDEPGDLPGPNSANSTWAHPAFARRTS